MPEFEYYDFENHLLINYYPFMTLFCQGGAFITGVLYSFTPYRVWNIWGTMMAGLCLPVDVIIFYKEPLGTIGTLVAMVLGFVPFVIMIADAAFPEEEAIIEVKGMYGVCFSVVYDFVMFFFILFRRKGNQDPKKQLEQASFSDLQSTV